MRLLGQLSALMSSPPEFPDYVTRAMHVAGYSVARDMMEGEKNAERLAAWREKSGAKIPAQKPSPKVQISIEDAMTNIAEAVNRKSTPQTNIHRIGSSKSTGRD